MRLADNSQEFTAGIDYPMLPDARHSASWQIQADHLRGRHSGLAITKDVAMVAEQLMQRMAGAFRKLGCKCRLTPDRPFLE